MGNRCDLISLKMCPRFPKIKNIFICKRKAKVQLSIKYIIQNVAHSKKENGSIKPLLLYIRTHTPMPLFCFPHLRISPLWMGLELSELEGY